MLGCLYAVFREILETSGKLKYWGDTLTLALSLREREQIVQILNPGTGFLPLPPGEGRGEGPFFSQLQRQLHRRTS
ncbi:hypothetical protein GCM10011445_10190 [Pseudocitrobacter faecalis]|nr:hypothetical protein GCM10011445_10190 [Pseudocitrobacter faecalis]